MTLWKDTFPIVEVESIHLDSRFWRAYSVHFATETCRSNGQCFPTLPQKTVFSAVDSYIKHWLRNAPTEEHIKEGRISRSHYQNLCSIRNTEHDEEHQVHLGSRLMHTTYATTAYSEDPVRSRHLMSVLRAKCTMEISIMQIASWLRLQENSWNETSEKLSDLLNIYTDKPLSASDTGGRMLMRGSSELDSVVVHTDDTFSKRQKLETNVSCSYPPFFAILTYDEAVPLWVWRVLIDICRSH